MEIDDAVAVSISGELLFGPIEHSIFLTEENDLAFTAELVKEIEERTLAFSVAVHGNIIKDQGTDFTWFGEILSHSDTEEEINLFGGTVGEMRRLCGSASGQCDGDGEVFGIDAHLVIAALSDERQAPANERIEMPGNGREDLGSGARKELLSQFQRLIELFQTFDLAFGFFDFLFSFVERGQRFFTFSNPPLEMGQFPT